MKSKYYFNGYYLVKGVKIFGKIRGTVISSANHSVYVPGSKVTVLAETFKEIDKNSLSLLKDWGYLSSF
jgi:hypothetical protein